MYSDAKDRWVQSRQIWNQHAYAVTDVNEDGTIPTTSTWAPNWSTTGLNNFRQNVPGEADGNPEGDLTAQAGSFFTCAGGQATLRRADLQPRHGPGGRRACTSASTSGGKKVCSGQTTTSIAIGQCVEGGVHVGVAAGGAGGGGERERGGRRWEGDAGVRSHE